MVDSFFWEKTKQRTDRYGGYWEGLQDIDELLKWLDNNEVDSVAIRRALMANYVWTEKMHEGWVIEIRAFTPGSLHVLF
ncbi:beta/alpha barrel domain-containing protein [Paenibacillus chitinolyticus]|uniref:hypothetical protein n=1 Tax=Paenibacillus chitinolyticus TaxID=79263 RepID=UPI00364CD2AE